MAYTVHLASYPGHVYTYSEGKVAWYPLFAHARTIPEIFHEQIRIRTSYTWLLCREITKLDIRLAVWQLCLRSDCFSLSVVSILLILASYPGHVPSCQILLGSQQLLVSYSAAVTDYSSADFSALRLATWSTIRDKSREKEWHDKDYATKQTAGSRSRSG